MTDHRAGKLVDEYKGFRCRLNCDGHLNVMYVQDDGTEACNGQTHNFRGTVDYLIRYPISVGYRWARGERNFSPYRDEQHVRDTCGHGVSLLDDCGACAESYGNARVG